MKKPMMFKRVMPALLALALAACGGGGSSSSSDSTATSSPSASNNAGGTLVMAGLAAKGAAMPKAAITLSDSKGNQLTTTADIGGHYVLMVDLSKFTPPFGLLAQDPSGGSENQVSLLAAVPANGQSAIVNITPLTTAVTAGSLSTGKPADVANPAVLAQVTAANVTAANSAITALLQNLVSDAGLSGNVDLIGKTFAANHTGIDQLLDEITVLPAGSGVQLINKLNLAGSNQVQVINQTAVASGTLTSTPFTIDFPSSTVAPSAFANIKSAWQGCFLYPVAQRVPTPGTLNSYCRNAVASTYLDNGYDFYDDFSGWLNNSDIVNPLMDDPVIQYAISTTKVVLHLTLRDSTGMAHSTNLVAQNIGGLWQITGNQLPYDVSVGGILEYDVNNTGTAAQTAAYRSELYASFTTGGSSPNPANTQYVVVTGPGIAQALVLAPNPSIAGIGYWPIDNHTGTAVTSTTGSSDTYKLGRVQINADGSLTTLANPSGATWAPASPDYSVFNGYPAYTFVLHFSDGTTATIQKRMSDGPVAPANGAGFAWNTLSTQTASVLIGDQPVLPSLGVSWTNVLGADPISKVEFTASTGTSGAQNTATVASLANTVTLVPPSGVSAFPALSVAAGGYRWLQLDYLTPGSVARHAVYNSN
ncbi:hypothetical protein HNQ50_000110 [Silvimonas terrae]|uniref:Carboxypeptidase regulatory-like domain-containing protein n=1 Tax=Silvimonas terrae TaxID=300266 RepID=A0A840RAN8_9NEIS|nr:hypothetical protein [Silvimonas terrae]MBB5189400.1 hypothetical protein [Silvimonas terrae]